MFGQQIGRHCQFTSLILLLAVFLAACASQTSQVESAPTISSEVTTTSPPTDTPAPTLTDEPYREPTATPTAEPTAIPAPTSVPQWDFQVYGALPSVTQRNGEMTVSDDGSVIFHFTVGEKNSPVYGQEFSLTVPPFTGQAMDLSGRPSDSLSLVTEPLVDREPMIGASYSPLLRMANASGETLAFFDYVSGQWRPTFENVTDLGQQEPEEWMPQELGVLKIYVSHQDGSNGEIKGDFIDLSLVGKPVRIFNEQMLYNGEWSKTVTWLELVYNHQGHTLFIPIFDSDNSDKPVMSGIEFVYKDDDIDLISTPYVLDGNYSTYKDLPTLLATFDRTSRVNLATVLYPESLMYEFNPVDWDWAKPSTYEGVAKIHNFWRSALQVDEANRQLQQQLAGQWLAGEPGNLDGVRWGYNVLGLLVVNSE